MDDGAVLFSPAAEIYFGLNSVGAMVWELLPPTSSSLSELCARVAGAYPDAPPDTIQTDVIDLLAQLESEGLVLPDEGAASDGPTP